MFVYNADGGLINAVKDVWHRVTSPSTYPCSLCKITYGASGMDRRWQVYVESLPFPVTLWHRDDLHRAHAEETSRRLPVVLSQRPNGRLSELVGATDLDRARTVDDVIGLVDAALAQRRTG